MKKLGLIVLVLIIIAGGWVYLADKFEHIAKEEILPKLNNNSSLIITDIDSVIIEKYKFKLTVPVVTIFPNSQYFKIVSDKMVMCYNPFTDRVSALFNGEKLSIGTGKTEIYIPSPNQTIKFNRSLLQKEFEGIDLQIISKDLSIYLAAEDKFISKASGANISFSSTLDSSDIYAINFGIDFNNMEMNPESKYAASLLEELIPAPVRDQIKSTNSLKAIDYYHKMIEKTGAINYSTEYSINLEKKHVDNIIANLKGEKEFLDSYEEFDVKKDKYSIFV